MAVTSSPQTDVIESLNPATGEVLGTVPIDTEEQVNAAVRRGRDAGDEWAALGFARRKEQLTAFRRSLASRADEIADLIHRENGKPALDGLTEVMMSVSHLHHATVRAEKALATKKVSAGLMANFRTTISYTPFGVIGVIGPWNYPMFTPMGSIGYALAAGNAVVFKPSELTPLVGQMLAEIASESLSVRNLFQVVTGDGRTGAALARSSVDKIAFTGSAGTGKRVMAAASENLTPVLLELGGKDAMIVAEDADIDKAAEAAVFGALTNSGQACVSVERVYVASPVYQQFVDKVLAETEKVRWGRDENAHIGAMTMPKQVDIVRDHMQDAIDKGATVLAGGPDAIDGPFIPPTVMTDVNHDMKIMTDETFGPVLPIQRVSGPDEAVELANSTTYGLGSSVFGKAGVRNIAAKIRAGMTAINSVQVYAGVPSLPFGGVGDSGFGRIHGDEGIREFAHVKATAEERFSLPLALASFNVPGNMYDRMRGMIQQIYGGGVVDKAGETIRKLFS